MAPDTRNTLRKSRSTHRTLSYDRRLSEAHAALARPTTTGPDTLDLHKREAVTRWARDVAHALAPHGLPEPSPHPAHAPPPSPSFHGAFPPPAPRADPVLRSDSHTLLSAHPPLRTSLGEDAALCDRRRKDREAAARLRTIDPHDITFAVGLSSYKGKHEFEVLAAALGIPAAGTVKELTSRIRQHLAAHPELEHNVRFVALYRGKRGLESKMREMAAAGQYNPHTTPVQAA